MRLPVALRPVSVKAPAEVHGNGADGHRRADHGWLRRLQAVQPAGLAKGFSDSTTVPAGVAVERTVTIGDGTKVAGSTWMRRNDAADLDLYATGSTTRGRRSLWPGVGHGFRG